MTKYVISGYLAGMIVFMLHFKRVNPGVKMSPKNLSHLALLSTLFPLIYLFAGAVRIVDKIR